MQLLKQILITGRGRPAALFVLLWSLTMNILTELPPSWPSFEKPWSLVTTYFGSPFTAGRNLLFDGYQRKHPREAKTQAVTIVAIDEKSLQTYGQWPWPRYRLAELIHALAQHQPAALGLDLYMPEPDQTSPAEVAKGLKSEHQALAQMLSRLPSHEEALVKSFHEVPTVLSAAGFDQAAYTTTSGMRTWPVQLVGADNLPVFSRRFDQVLASLPELQAAAKGQALVSVDLDNGLVRQVPMVMNMGDQAVPGLALEMFRVASASPAVKTHLDGAGIAWVEVADLIVPTLPNGNIFVHFATHRAMASRYLSAIDVIQGRVDPQMLSGKLVLLGLTGSGLTDMRTNAIGETVPGIEIQAQVIESLFDGRILQRPYWLKWTETLTLLIVAGGLIWYVPRPGSLMATYLRKVPKSSLWLMLATNGLIIWIGFAIFIHTGMLFDAASFFLIISAVMGSLVSTVLVGIDNLKKSQEARQESVLQEARVASDRAVLAQLIDGQGRVPTHIATPLPEEA